MKNTHEAGENKILIERKDSTKESSVITDSKENTPKPILIKFNNGTKKPNLYCVPGGGGHANTYFELGKLYGKESALYIFESKGLYGLVPPLKTVEEMATLYIEEMQKVDPIGPYCIGGYSFGGIVAFEMTVQLQKMGFQVSNLIIFDTVCPIYFSSKESQDTDEQWLCKWTHYCAKRYDATVELKPEDLVQKSIDEQYKIINDKLEEIGITFEPDYLKGSSQVWISNNRYRYKVGNKNVGNTPVRVFSTQPNIDYGWKALTTGEVDVMKVKGHHFHIFRQPTVQSIALKLNRLINE